MLYCWYIFQLIGGVMGIKYPIYFLSKIKPYPYTKLPTKYDRHRQKSGGVFL